MARKGYGRNSFTPRPLRTDRAHGTGVNRNHYDRPDSKARGLAKGQAVQSVSQQASELVDWPKVMLLHALDMRELGYQLSPEQYKLCFDYDQEHSDAEA